MPPDRFHCRLGHRSGMRLDPDRHNDPEHITRLVGQVIRVSLDSVSILRSLPA